MIRVVDRVIQFPPHAHRYLGVFEAKLFLGCSADHEAILIRASGSLTGDDLVVHDQLSDCRASQLSGVLDIVARRVPVSLEHLVLVIVVNFRQRVVPLVVHLRMRHVAVNALSRVVDELN